MHNLSLIYLHLLIFFKFAFYLYNMEYEIYYLCNLLGIALVIIIVLFHFVDADKKPKIKDAQASKDKKNVNLIK
jgi:hypothetical protein